MEWETGASGQSTGLTPGGMPKSAARALGLLPYCSRQDVVAHSAKAQVAHGEDGPTDGTQGEKSAITRIGQKPDIGQWSPSKGQGQGAHSSRVQPIRVQRKKIYPSTKPKLN